MGTMMFVGDEPHCDGISGASAVIREFYQQHMLWLHRFLFNRKRTTRRRVLMMGLAVSHSSFL